MQRYLKYGNPLVDEDDLPVDDHLKGGGILFKKPVQIFDQIVTDEKGRRRFHGAFTGGFSAGYFNTVGTPEGWAPSTFKSSKDAKNTKNLKPEDFMDEEDFGEFGIAPKNLDITKNAERKYVPSVKRSEITESINDLFNIADIKTVGINIFLNLGGKSGRGVGELIHAEVYNHNNDNSTRKTYGCALPPNKSNNLQIENLEEIVFEILPHDIKPYIIETKLDYSGFKTKDEHKKSNTNKPQPKSVQEQESFAFALGSTFMETVQSQKRKGITGKAFGYGALDSDEEDDIFDDVDSYGGALARNGVSDSLVSRGGGVNSTSYSLINKYDIPIFKEQGDMYLSSKSSSRPSTKRSKQSRFGEEVSESGKEAFLTNFCYPFHKSCRSSVDSGSTAALAQHPNLPEQTRKHKHEFKKDYFLERLKNLLIFPDKSAKSAKFKYLKYLLVLIDVNRLTYGQENKKLDNSKLWQKKPLIDTKIRDRSIQIDSGDIKMDKSTPLFKPFQYNLVKQNRYSKFILNLELYFKFNLHANRNDRDFFKSLSPRQIDRLFDNINYDDVTEWDRDREKAEFMNIAKFTFLKSVNNSFKFSLNSIPDFYKVEEAPAHENVLTYGLNSRFHKSATLETLKAEEDQLIQENEIESQVRQYLVKGEFGIGKTRQVFDWCPDSLVCKRFGVKYLGNEAALPKTKPKPIEKTCYPPYGEYWTDDDYLLNPFEQSSAAAIVQRVVQTSNSENLYTDTENNTMISLRTQTLNKTQVIMPKCIESDKLFVNETTTVPFSMEYDKPVQPRVSVSKTLPPEVLKAIFDSSEDSLDSEEEIEMYRRKTDPKYQPNLNENKGNTENEADEFIMSILKSTL